MTPSGASLADDLQCICISNEEVKGLTILHYGETIPVYEGDHYSVQTALSLEAPLDEGICIGVHFLNAAGQPLGTEQLSPLFNLHDAYQLYLPAGGYGNGRQYVYDHG